MDSFIGEIRLLPYTYAPDQWAWCNGQQIAISQNQALYAVINAIYGGDGRTYFNLPNLTTAMGQPGCAPIGAGSGPGLTPRALGKDKIGAAAIQLVLSQTPAHNHTLTAQSTSATANYVAGPSNAWLGRGYVQGADAGFYTYDAYDATKQVAFSNTALSVSGSNPPQAHDNMQPCLTMSFCISLAGEFPVRP
jgi:microcystin-dependent protein